jgi:mevalonate pyrophosphate decarboxylase
VIVPDSVAFVQKATTAEAHPVQGLVCVHGYSDPVAHLLPVDGIFLALGAFPVTATVTAADDGTRPGQDLVVSSNDPLRESEIARIQTFVSTATSILGTPAVSEVRINHDLGGGCGLGSSAAVFASLTRALADLGGVTDESDTSLASIARLGSYSAAASFRGGLARVCSSGEAVNVALPSAWDLETVVLTVPPRSIATEKASSRIHGDVVTSPYYEAWQTLAAEAARETLEALASSDFTSFRRAIERYVLYNLGVMVSGREGEIPWEGETLRLFHYLKDLRRNTGADFGVSANSGPSVFAFGRSSVISSLVARIAEDSPDVRCIRSRPGTGAHAVEEAGREPKMTCG